MKKIVVLGGDGFCGWPTSLKLASNGWEVLIIDNLSRRDIDNELGASSIIPISSIDERIEVANSLIGKVHFQNIDITREYQALERSISDFQPNCIIHFAEQRAAPYSMLGMKQRRYTVDNNVSGTHNVLNAIVEVDTSIHLIHLGTMGVYGYNKDFGKIPEGYLDIEIKETNAETSILYPANPGSVYHMTKCLDQLMFQFYNKNWDVPITDLHQGIVWGVETELTRLDKRLANRFDYDGIYGTVLNRFLIQAANNHPLSVYGTGGQSRALINISDTARCISLAAENVPDTRSVRIFNQVSEVRSVLEMAELVSKLFKTEINFIDNPRNELASNELEVENTGLVNLGFNPIRLETGLLEDIQAIANVNKAGFKKRNVNNSPKW